MCLWRFQYARIPHKHIHCRVSSRSTHLHVEIKSSLMVARNSQSLILLQWWFHRSPIVLINTLIARGRWAELTFVRIFTVELAPVNRKMRTELLFIFERMTSVGTAGSLEEIGSLPIRVLSIFNRKLRFRSRDQFNTQKYKWVLYKVCQIKAFSRLKAEWLVASYHLEVKLECLSVLN